MGARASKMDSGVGEAEQEKLDTVGAVVGDGGFARSTVDLLNQTPITVKTDFEIGNYLDPRSPSSCRTPLGEILSNQRTPVETYQQSASDKFLENPGGVLKKKFLKGFTYNLNDPRSPTVDLSRTPIVFEDLDNTNEKSFALDDTFSDLLVETRQPAVLETKTETTKDAAPVESPHRDPRSPSMEVERTPIIFADDTPDDVEMIESVLEALSLQQQQDAAKPQNKPLDRVRNNAKRRNTRKSRKPKIYEDVENVMSSTPKCKKFDSPLGKRTPLGCVANKSHLRSRSVENSGKSLKMRVPPSSLDDNNLILTKKNLHFGQENENSFEIF